MRSARPNWPLSLGSLPFTSGTLSIAANRIGVLYGRESLLRDIFDADHVIAFKKQSARAHV